MYLYEYSSTNLTLTVVHWCIASRMRWLGAKADWSSTVPPDFFVSLQSGQIHLVQEPTRAQHTTV